MYMMAKWEKKSKVRHGHFELKCVIGKEMLCKHCGLWWHVRFQINPKKKSVARESIFTRRFDRCFYHTFRRYKLIDCLSFSASDRIDCLLWKYLSLESQHLAHNDRYISHFHSEYWAISCRQPFSSFGVYTFSKWGKQFRLVRNFHHISYIKDVIRISLYAWERERERGREKKKVLTHL